MRLVNLVALRPPTKAGGQTRPACLCLDGVAPVCLLCGEVVPVMSRKHDAPVLRWRGTKGETPLRSQL
jgi:hypothetical protein